MGNIAAGRPSNNFRMPFNSLKGSVHLVSSNNEPLDLVLGNYPIKVLEVKNESYKDKKGVWWIKTSNGMLILKKISNSEATLRFILDAVNHLSIKGVLLPDIIKTKDGRDYVDCEGTCYVLTQAIEGRNPSYTDIKEMNLITAALAAFHKASAGFFPLPETKPKFHLGLWCEDYTEQLEDINSFYKNELLQKDNNAIGKVIIKDFPYFYYRACSAIDGLKGIEYGEWVKKAEKAGCLCHQDFAAGNLILTYNENIYVLDTDSITVDIPARDIRKLLNKVMKKAGKWDMTLAKRILSQYQAVNPLADSEWLVLKLDLTFPHLFLGAVNKYYYRRDKEWSEEKYLQRICEMSKFEKTIQPVLDNFDSIIPI